MRVHNLIHYTYNYFLYTLPSQYPNIVELFKNERFFKEIGIKLDSYETITDSAVCNTKLFEMNI